MRHTPPTGVALLRSCFDQNNGHSKLGQLVTNAVSGADCPGPGATVMRPQARACPVLAEAVRQAELWQPAVFSCGFNLPETLETVRTQAQYRTQR